MHSLVPAYHSWQVEHDWLPALVVHQGSLYHLAQSGGSLQHPLNTHQLLALALGQTVTAQPTWVDVLDESDASHTSKILLEMPLDTDLHVTGGLGWEPHLESTPLQQLPQSHCYQRL